MISSLKNNVSTINLFFFACMTLSTGLIMGMDKNPLTIGMDNTPHKITIENRIARFIYAGPVSSYDKSYQPIPFKGKAVFLVPSLGGIAYMKIAHSNHKSSEILIGIEKKEDHIIVSDMHHILIQNDNQLITTEFVKTSSKL